MVRVAMFAEHAGKVLDEARRIQAMPSNPKGLAARELRELHAAKSAAAQDIATFEPLLYPAD